jgi:HSP20 family protein
MTKEIQTRDRRLEPTTDLDPLFEELHREFWESFGIAPFAGPSGAGVLRAARTDVSDTGPTYKIVAEVPGIPKEKIDIRVRGTNVEIRGEQATETEEKAHEYVHRERRYAGYYRSVDLPEPVVAENASAKVANGLLELELPKRTPTPPEAEVKVRVG